MVNGLGDGWVWGAAWALPDGVHPDEVTHDGASAERSTCGE